MHLRRITNLSAILALLLAAPVASQAQETGRPATDALLESVAFTAKDSLGLTREVWPGWAPPPQFLICRSSGPTVVAGDSATLALLGAAGDAARGGVSILPKPPSQLGVCFDIAFTVGTAKLIAVPLIGPLYSVKDSLTANLVQLYHESFHAYQGKAFAPTRAGQYTALQEIRLPLDVVRSQPFDSLARVERSLLAEAIWVDRVDSVRGLLARYLEVRDSRLQLLPQRLRLAEAHNERKEGSAHWVGYTSALLRMRRTRADVAALVVQDLQQTPSFAAGQADDYFSNAYRQQHIYATGAAIAVILERLKAPWRSAVQSGATFEELLRSNLLKAQ